MRRSLWLVAVVAALSLVVAACGSDNNKKSATATTAVGVACAPGNLSGGGSSFVKNIVQQWAKDYQAKCTGANISYQPVGSGAGVQQFTAGTIDFGASDFTLKPEEEQAAAAKGGQVLQIPWASGGIAIEYNLSGVTDLKLTPETLAGIFTGKIKTWNDPALKADNSSANLPSTGIQMIHRSDGSGSTYALSAFLSATVPSAWAFPVSKDFPVQAGQGAKGTDGVTAAVKQAPGAIGYAEVSYAKANALGIAQVKNAYGSFVLPDTKNVVAALAEAQIPPDLKIKPNYKPAAANAYPISTFTWVLVFAKPAAAAKGKALKDFLLYAVGPGQASAEGLDYAPLTESLQAKDTAAVNSIQA